MVKNLHKIFILLLINFILHISAFAQQDSIPRTHVGLKAGFGYSNLNFEPALEQEFYQNYSGGLVFKHIQEGKLGIQVELNYARTGWQQVPVDSNSTVVPTNNTLSYLELPLMTHISLGKKKSGIIINFGPSISVLLSSKDTIIINNESFPSEPASKNLPNRFTYGLCLGLGYVQQTPVGIFQLEGRISHGLGNMLNSGFYDTSQSQQAMVSLSYLIATRKRKTTVNTN